MNEQGRSFQTRSAYVRAAVAVYDIEAGIAGILYTVHGQIKGQVWHFLSLRHRSQWGFQHVCHSLTEFTKPTNDYRPGVHRGRCVICILLLICYNKRPHYSAPSQVPEYVQKVVHVSGTPEKYPSFSWQRRAIALQCQNFSYILQWYL